MDRTELRQRIKDSLWLYHDYSNSPPKIYLRFAPLETEQFRHGISLGVQVLAGKEAEAKDTVADYLVDSFLCLVEEK